MDYDYDNFEDYDFDDYKGMLAINPNVFDTPSMCRCEDRPCCSHGSSGMG